MSMQSHYFCLIKLSFGTVSVIAFMVASSHKWGTCYFSFFTRNAPQKQMFLSNIKRRKDELLLAICHDRLLKLVGFRCIIQIQTIMSSKKFSFHLFIKLILLIIGIHRMWIGRHLKKSEKVLRVTSHGLK